MSGVDVAGPTRDAEREFARYADLDPAYSELMAVYASLGALLARERTDPDFAEECRELMDRAVALDRVLQAEFDEQWALWCARYTTFGGRNG